MNKSIQPELTYERLLYLLRRNILRYKVALYSVGYLTEMVLKTPANNSNHINLNLIPTWDTLHDTITIEPQDLIIEISKVAKENHTEYDDYIQRVMQFNAHLTRTGTLNYAYEIIKSYSDKNRALKITEQLKKEKWYAVLYVLRNNASHADNMHKILSFERCEWIRKQHGKSFIYDNIKITEGAPADMIRYNDRHVLSLLYSGLDYIEHSPLFM